MDKDLLEFDWDPTNLKPYVAPSKRYVKEFMHKKESWLERTDRMLTSIHDVTINCSMCSLGRQMCEEYHSVFDPHVFSNMNPSKWMIVGQNPGFNECKRHEPFVGDAGKFFDSRVARYGLKRSDFYISNVVKCHTIGNSQPLYEHISSCEPIIRMELMLLKPYLVITLGAVAFGAFCPDRNLTTSLGNIHVSTKFNVKVFPIYHPSPRNMEDPERFKRFNKDIKTLCQLIRRYRQLKKK